MSFILFINLFWFPHWHSMQIAWFPKWHSLQMAYDPEFEAWVSYTSYRQMLVWSICFAPSPLPYVIFYSSARYQTEFSSYTFCPTLICIRWKYHTRLLEKSPRWIFKFHHGFCKNLHGMTARALFNLQAACTKRNGMLLILFQFTKTILIMAGSNIWKLIGYWEHSMPLHP